VGSCDDDVTSVHDVATEVTPVATRDHSKRRPQNQDWYRCLKSCEARGEMCTCRSAEGVSAGTDSSGSKPIGTPSILPTAALGDAKAVRELLLLRSSLLTADVGGDGTYVGPLHPMATSAMARIHELMNQPSLNRFCQVHLRLNDLHYESYELTEKRFEDVETRSDNTDFYMTAKVDTHLHLSALMTSPELLAYLGEIFERDGHLPLDDKQTIGEMLLSAGFEPGRSAIDDLRTQSTDDMYRDFDEFNAAFTPFRSKALADLLFKTTVLGGRYLKEIISRMAAKAAPHNIFLEPRVSIYARKYAEWFDLADWFERAKPQHRHVLFAIQFPRIYHVWKEAKAVATFAELLHNFFGPLFEATASPEKHAALSSLLSQIGCIDTVDNEAQDDAYFVDQLPPASQYDGPFNPPYSYYTVYFWHNLRALNAMRHAKGLNTFQLRPHAGEAGPVHHLACTFLFAHGISHGINLADQPVLQYIHYLAAVPISVSPISNACLFLPYARNPFSMLFKRGLLVTLTTDDPLQFHMSNQPQLEEYTTAKHAWGLSMTDLSEIARNSVLISSAPPDLREELIGGDDPCDRCNVPKRRFDFRHDERLRNHLLLGLPPPSYPVSGLQRTEPLHCTEADQVPSYSADTAGAADGAAHRPCSSQEVKSSIMPMRNYTVEKQEEAWRNSHAGPSKPQRGLLHGLSRRLLSSDNTRREKSRGSVYAPPGTLRTEHGSTIDGHGTSTGHKTTSRALGGQARVAPSMVCCLQ